MLRTPDSHPAHSRVPRGCRAGHASRLGPGLRATPRSLRINVGRAPPAARAMEVAGAFHPGVPAVTLDRAWSTDKSGVSGRASRRGADVIAAVEPEPRQPRRL